MMSSILDLPFDIVLTIGDHISRLAYHSSNASIGLATHIALSRTCRQLRSFYTFDSSEAEDAFWQDACAAAGFGRPLLRDDEKEEYDEPPLSWRELALILVGHERVCEIRSCKDATGWIDPYRASTLPGGVAFHPLFYYLHFSPVDQALDAISILLTHLPTVPGGRLQAYAPLAGHARASCAFATYPPVREISIVRPGADEDEDEEDETVLASVCNPEGCTLLDLNRLLVDILPRSTENVNTVMAHYHTLLESYHAPEYSFVQTLREGHHRGFMRDHSYPYLDETPLPDDAFDTRKTRSAGPGVEALSLRCSNGPRRASQAGIFVRDLLA